SSAHPEGKQKTDEIEDHEPDPGSGKCLPPLGVFVLSRCVARAFADHLLDVAHRSGSCESALVYVDLIMIFERTKQFDAAKRVELQVHLKIRRRVHLSERFAAH